ncbi:MAG: hypothetical protein Q8L87_09965 [Anaerolineales bacterium]|nr:hypothetical protein [Anaerolineales bacterium]
MALLQPILFSQHFGTPAAAFKIAGLLDPILNSDTKLFVDPLLVKKSSNRIIKAQGKVLLERNFRDILQLLEISEAEGDPAWKGAYRGLNLDERSETGLGYGGASTSGSSRSVGIRR